jgi:low affinity Fe/Cu permease
MKRAGRAARAAAAFRLFQCAAQVITPRVPEETSIWQRSVENKGAPRPLRLAAVVIVAIWAITGPFFHFSDTWQLVINTGTTIVTFLMVFLIQATQNRDTLALQIKLSELILALEGARNELAAVEKEPEGILADIAEEIHQRAGSETTPLFSQSESRRLPRQLRRS